jgi:hypothetical protein
MAVAATSAGCQHAILANPEAGANQVAATSDVDPDAAGRSCLGGPALTATTRHPPGQRIPMSSVMKLKARLTNSGLITSNTR